MLEHKAWTAESLLRLLLRLFLLLGVTGLGAVAAERLWTGVEGETRQFWSSTAASLVVQLGGITLIVFFLRENDLNWETAFGLRRAGATRQILLGLAVAVVVFGVALLLIKLSQWLMREVHLTPQPQSAIEALQSTTDPRRQAAVALTAVVLAPVFEEVIFRGLLLVSLRQAGYPRFAFWGTAVFFAVTHLNLMTFLPLVFFAVVLNLFYLRTGSLVGPITAHAAFNATNFFWVVLAGPGS
jgi:membrane protease YdiL (CAAX protease family)